MAQARRSLRILFLVSAHNSLSQRAYLALTELGHEVAVAVVDSGAATEAAVLRHRPELIVCPMLKKLIPESIWSSHRCLIVHPGPKGDRGPSSLDWAIELGVAFALAADEVVAREDIVLNPYYGHMGGLYGSEYWTYLLPRRVGADMTDRLTSPPFRPMGTRHAVEIGLLDAAFGRSVASFRAQARARAERLARSPAAGRLVEKRIRRTCDEQRKPLEAYRAEEMIRSHRCFFGHDRSYHEARHRFAYKLGKPGAATPSGASLRAA
jgi:hypothetical protein